MKKISRIVAILKKEYGKPKFAFYSNPLEELIITVLSQNTSWQNTRRSFKGLKQKFKSWKDVQRASIPAISRAIKIGGLGNIKAERIKGILGEIKNRTGNLSLLFLRTRSTKEALLFLRSLKGVGPKTAAVVLLFSLNRPVLPVDTHVLRVSKRMGLIPFNTTLEKAHDILGKKMPEKADQVLSFHVNMIEHGRKICKAQRPRCAICVLMSLCKYKEKSVWK